MDEMTDSEIESIRNELRRDWPWAEAETVDKIVDAMIKYRDPVNRFGCSI